MTHLRRVLGSVLGVGALITGTLVAAGPPAAADTSHFYVDCSASASGDGDAGSPWNTTADVNAHAFAPGDTISFKSGTTCTGTLQPQGSGSAGAPITIDSYGEGAKPVVDGDGAYTALRLVDQSYWTISALHLINPSDTRTLRTGVSVESTTTADKAGITIKGLEVSDVAGWGDKTGTNGSWFAYSAGIVVKVNGTAVGHYDGITITDNLLHDTGGGGIKITGDTDSYNTGVYVARNTINAAGGDGIVVHDSDAPLVEHNTALDLGLGDYPFTGGNFAGMWAYNSMNPTFQYNVVGRSRPVTFDATAWDCDHLVKGTCTYQYNYSFGNAGGLYLNCLLNCATQATSTNVVLRYNIAQDDCRMVLSNGGTGTHYIYNNTFFCPSRPIVDTIGSNKVVTNNIFVAPGGSFTTGSNITFDSNSYYGGIQPPAGDAHAITGDPKIVAPGSGAESLEVPGYKLQTGSTALGSGAVIADNGGKDLFGTAVSATAAPNRGAYGGPGVTPEPLPITSLFNQVGVTSDANPSAGGLSSDTQTGRTFSGQALEAAGLTPGSDKTVGGVTFPWHRGTYGNPDHVKATGQDVKVQGSGSTLGFLGFSTTNGTTGSGTLHFSDGTSEPYTVTLTDWWATAPLGNNIEVARAAYQNQHATPYNATNTAPYQHPATVWFTSVPLPAGKTLISVTLPDGSPTAGTGLHFFDVRVGGAPQPTPAHHN